ncbi:MAG: hypothetical protein ACRCWQ_06010 [Bacilli bacterium]
MENDQMVQISQEELELMRCELEIKKVEKHLAVLNEDFADSGGDFMGAFALVKEIEETEKQLEHHKQRLLLLQQK